MNDAAVIAKGEARRQTSRLLGYGVVRVTVEGVLAIRGIVLAQLIGAHAFGAWALFRLLMGYSVLTGLGVIRGLERSVSSADETSGERERDSRSFVGFGLLMFGAASLIAATMAYCTEEAGTSLALAGVAGCLMLERFWFYGITYLRAVGRFRDFAAIELGTAVLNLMLVVGLAWFFGLIGALIGFALACLAGFIAAAPALPIRPEFQFDRLRPMLAVGLPLTLSYLLHMLMTSVDRVVLLAFTDFETLGLYAFAVAVGGLGAACGAVVRTLAFPTIYRQSVQTGVVAGTQDFARTTILPFAWLMPPVLALVALLLPGAIQFLTPSFIASMPAAILFLFAGVASGQAQLLMLAIIAADRQTYIPLVTSLALAMNLGGAMAILMSDSGIGLLAVLAVGAQIFNTAALTLLLELGGQRRQRTRMIISAVCPTIWCAGLAALVNTISPALHPTALATALGLTMLGIIPMVPVLWVVLRDAWK